MTLGRAATQTFTKTHPDKTKYVESKPTVSGDKGSTVDQIRESNRKTKEAADKAGE